MLKQSHGTRKMGAWSILGQDVISGAPMMSPLPYNHPTKHMDKVFNPLISHCFWDEHPGAVASPSVPGWLIGTRSRHHLNARVQTPWSLDQRNTLSSSGSGLGPWPPHALPLPKNHRDQAEPLQCALSQVYQTILTPSPPLGVGRLWGKKSVQMEQNPMINSKAFHITVTRKSDVNPNGPFLSQSDEGDAVLWTCFTAISKICRPESSM
jgi:hypothetical protein